MGFPGWLSIHLPMQEMQEMWVQFPEWEDPLEKEMATHSSIFAQKIQWTEEPDGAIVHAASHTHKCMLCICWCPCEEGSPGGSEVKASACNAGDLGSIPGSGRSSGKGNGNPLQCSCLENPMDRGAWWAIVPGVTKSRTRLSDFTSLHVRRWVGHVCVCMYVCV